MDKLKTLIYLKDQRNILMDNLQNNKKTVNNTNGQMSVFNKNYLQNNPNRPLGSSVYDYSIKKTEKLVTALYMITDCMDTDDAIKVKLRLLGIELLSKTHRLPIASPSDQAVIANEVISHIHEIFSLIEISSTLGYISDMNARILKKEFSLLSEELGLHQTSQSINLSDDLFVVERSTPHSQNKITTDFHTYQTIHKGQKNNYKGQTNFSSQMVNKKTSYIMPFINKNVVSQVSKRESLKTSSVSNLTNKKDRRDKILSLIKDKKEVSIKDISGIFLDVSEKTIQRELNTLVTLGQIKKIGSKRWSRYAVVNK